jgi:glycosyltransferase involved in cell wall biosynthesis
MRLHRELRRQRYESSFRHCEGVLPLPGVQRLTFGGGLGQRAAERLWEAIGLRQLRPVPPSYFAESRRLCATPIPKEDGSADVVHLHWVSRWLDLRSFVASLPASARLVWTVHDMSPLAGGCFTDFGCPAFGKGCRRCPVLRPPFDRFRARRELLHRKSVLHSREVTWVGNSSFTTGLIRRSELVAPTHRIATIHPGLDTDVLQPMDRALARSVLGLDPATLVLGFGAADLGDPNKGLDRFLAVASLVARRAGRVTALVFGGGVPAAAADGVDVRCLGRVSSPELQRLVYSAMDAFVMCSRMETFGLVATEAQACGTPVWAFGVGGLVDAVADGISGRLLAFGDVEAMAGTLASAAAASSLPGMGQAGRDWVRERFSIRAMTDKYLAVYCGQSPCFKVST